jgi:glycosyltransferase involved in cell wall biosynthesis
MPEICGNAPSYFDPDDPGDIAVKILEILRNDTLRAELVRRGFVRANEFSWQRTAQATLDAYTRAAAMGAHRS